MPAKHRLVCLGDSVTQGFKSGAIFEPETSFPAIIAWEMGLRDDAFRFAPFAGEGGLPLNIENLLRRLDHRYGANVNVWEIPQALASVRSWMDQTEDYWERGPGAAPLSYNGPFHNLAVWGFDLQDAFNVTAAMCREKTENPSDDWLLQIPDHAMYRTALRVLNPSHSTEPIDTEATGVKRAKQLAADGGIENLIVFLGNNNVLGSVLTLEFIESTDREINVEDPSERKATVWTPAHYATLLDRLVQEVEAIGAERVFWGTVPAVTIPPVTNGVGGRLEADPGVASPHGKSDDPKWFRRYFNYYTRPWVPDDRFRPDEDKHLTGNQVIEIERTILSYKGSLKDRVEEHNGVRKGEGKDPDWFIVDTHWTLERLAFRRYREDPSVPPPPGWEPYKLPQAYVDLGLDTRFLRAKNGRRIQGGFFSLDGVHPTTAGCGILAQEFIDVMHAAGVNFTRGDGHTERSEPVKVDYERVLKQDTMVYSLPQTLDDLWGKLVDGDQFVDIFKRALHALFP